MGYLYRCTARIKSGLSKGKTCGCRRALPHKVGWYKRPPTCRRCGAVLRYIDKLQQLRNKKTTCRCDGAHFPHRKGSVPLCGFWKGEPEARPVSRYVLPDGSVADLY